MRKILLSLIIILLASAAFAGYLTRDNTNETVTDSTNNLMWQDNAVVATATYTWADAIDYCENLDFAGHTDWRLPTINELRSIADYDKVDPAIFSTFQNVNTSEYFNNYWTSTTDVSHTSDVWVIRFASGGDDQTDKTASYFVRCVR